ncbi:MAG TPA: tetratricopeptide repeat protein [Thermoanaerobaculia bacterium]|nr:tetratricopeptide repeat protein [Thermoanaerobaculia bacterium]
MIDSELLARPTEAIGPSAPAAVVKTLLLIDLVDSTGLLARIGDKRAQEVFSSHDQLARTLLAHFDGREIDKSDGFLLLFDRPIQAVTYALAYHESLARLGERTGLPLEARAGIHLGEVFLRENSAVEVAQGAKPLEVEGLAKHTVARVCGLAQGRQTLLTHAAFDLARRASVGETMAARQPRWLAHGPYLLQGIDEPVEVFEVGLAGSAPLAAPQDSPKARRAVPLGDEVTLGWRPAVALEIPWRHHWRLDRKLGDGGFGEVWLARHEKTGDHRVFKFCYDAARLRALKREVMLFRILKDTLGERDDIARILDWNFKEAPFFLESEYLGSDFPAWAEAQGGVAAVPLDTRLEIVAQVATALGAAHSVGILHKDIKPSNVLITTGLDGRPKARLTDFGIGLLTDAARKPAVDITMAGWTEMAEPGTTSTVAGTRLYLAPELLEGKPPTMQSDLYALGVLLYQVVAGDLRRALAPGWERDVPDALLVEDIAMCADRDPAKRPRSAPEIADRLRQLEARRQARAAAEQAQREADEMRQALASSRRRRRLLAVFTSLVLIFSVAMAFQMRRTAQEAQRANREAETSSRISEFLVGLFELSEPNASAGNTITAREILDRGVVRIRSELRDQPEIRATLMARMALAYLRLSLYEPAIELQREALSLRQTALGPEHPDVAKSLLDLGNTLVLQGRFAEAEPPIRQALALRRKLLDENHPDVVDVTARLADLELYTGRYTEAEHLYQDALARQEAGGDYPSYFSDRGQMLITLALLYELEGRNEVVQATYDDALALLRKGLGNDHTFIGITLGNKGEWLTRQGRYKEAEACLSQARDIVRRRSGPDHLHTGFSLYKLAELANARSQHRDAESLARNALSILQAKLPAGHWRIAVAESILGESLRGQQSYAEAERLLLASSSVLRNNSGLSSIYTQQALKSLITLYESWERPADAGRYRALLNKLLPPAGRRLSVSPGKR